MTISKEFKVGLFTVVGFVLLYMGFNFLKGIDFLSSRNRYFAIYQNVDKLMASNQVYLNGFAVGRVSDIRILPKKQNRVLVEMEIDSDVVLRDSSKAILSSDFLGNKSILLEIGPLEANPVKKGDTILSGLDKGIADILATAAPVADNLQTTLRKLNKILDDLGRNTDKLDEIFNELESTPKLFNKTLSNWNDKMDDVSGSIRSISDGLNNTLTKLDPTLSNFKTISDSLKQIQLNGTLTRVQQSLAKLNATLDKLNKGDNTMSKLMTEDTLYVNLNKLLVSLDSLANHVNENPKHFMAPLGKSRKRIERDLKKQEEEDQKK